MSNFQFTTRNKGEFLRKNESTARLAIDVSSYGESPYNLFSPYTFSADFFIPVPGTDDFAHSVEAIWQGLKVIDGKTNPKAFRKRPRKRRGAVEGHQYGEEILGIEESRWLIYVPSYKHYLDHFIPQEIISDVLKAQRTGAKVFLYDVENNGDIRNPEPLAHAAVLATYLNFKVLNNQYDPGNDEETSLQEILEGDESLWNKLSLVSSKLDSDGFRQAVRYKCLEHPSNLDEYHLGKALEEKL